MTTKKTTTKAVAKTADEEVLKQLADQYPQQDSFTRPKWPKLVFVSQTKLDDEDNVAIKAGTFFLDTPPEDEGEWDREELGKTVEGHIIYVRKRLQMWSDEEEKMYNTPVFDKDDEVLPLFAGRDLVTNGTPAELKALYAENREVEDFKTGEPKVIKVSKLKPQRVLYVMIGEKMAELTIKGTSMRQFSAFQKKHAVPTFITKLSSSKQEKGSTKWNQMEFAMSRDLTADEAKRGLKHVEDLKELFAAEKAFYASKRAESAIAAEPAPLPAGAAEALPAGEGEDEDF